MRVRHSAPSELCPLSEPPQVLRNLHGLLPFTTLNRIESRLCHTRVLPFLGLLFWHRFIYSDLPPRRELSRSLPRELAEF